MKQYYQENSGAGTVDELNSIRQSKEVVVGFFFLNHIQFVFSTGEFYLTVRKFKIVGMFTC